jgi:flavin-dependent dehydrogenase
MRRRAWRAPVRYRSPRFAVALLAMIQTATPDADDRIQPPVADRYDAVVVGGGPAGASAAAVLAEAGKSVLLLERRPAGRFHVGESLIPETYWSLKRLGLVDRLDEVGFVKKYSVQFVNDTGKESAPFYFDLDETGRPHGKEGATTWQVERGPFDRMVMERAEELGATVRTDAHVLDVLWDGEPLDADGKINADARAAGVKVKLGRGDEAYTKEIQSTVLIDATGQTAFLGRRLGTMAPDPHLKKGTLWSYWENAERSPDDPREDGCTVIIQGKQKKTWFWYIPLGDGITSVGCTGDMSHMFGPHRTTPEETYESEIAAAPGIARRLQNATRVRDVFTTKDFSYYSGVGAGNGWTLVGDAFGFIDPVYSSGVFLALDSGIRGGEAAAAAVTSGDASAAALGAWQPDYKKGVENFRKLVYAFYDESFSIGGFLRDYPQFKMGIVDVLVGNVFRPELDEMFEHMPQSRRETAAA